MILLFFIKRVNIFGEGGFHIPSSLTCDNDFLVANHYRWVAKSQAVR
jgi:hypothetical protein